MPPNLGGFFMVRSYYPSECHADYFDFERIEALKPAIEACGISTLSQSPMLGFHKQMDNRIKLLEEILSFRMQGVEFDNGDMYVDGHKAASDVRDEFVSVTEKLMDELAQCYNVLPQLDINNTIDHRPEGDEKWFLENEKTVTQFCRKLAAERPLKDIRDEYNYPKKKGIKDECSRLLEASTMKSRRGFAIQRLMNAMRQAHADGWFIVFDTLTLADDRLEAFYDNPNALRDYFRDIGRMVLAAEGRKANDSHADCYQYFCVPEYGTANGRLHFHDVHFMRTLPTGSVDPNFGRRVRNRRQLNSFFFQSEDGIRVVAVTGVQTCALPILRKSGCAEQERCGRHEKQKCQENPTTCVHCRLLRQLRRSQRCDARSILRTKSSFAPPHAPAMFLDQHSVEELRQYSRGSTIG